MTDHIYLTFINSSNDDSLTYPIKEVPCNPRCVCVGGGGGSVVTMFTNFDTIAGS